MASHNTTGAAGEALAREYLVREGYAIYEQNKRIGAEIDIIAFKDNIVAFVEVKTRTERLTDPMQVVTARQRARICRAADTFIRTREIVHEPRFDIIIVNILPDGTHTVTHYPGAYLPPLLAR